MAVVYVLAGLAAIVMFVGVTVLVLWLRKILLPPGDCADVGKNAIAPTNFYVIGSGKVTSELREYISPIRTVVMGTQPIAFSISPALPDGLMLSATTGSIQGMPQIPLTNTTFTITARNVAGHATVCFSLAVKDVIPDFGFPTLMQGRRELQTGQSYAFTPVVISQSGKAPSRTIWTVTPPFATELGLSLDSVTGKLSGTVSAIAETKVYRVRVTNATDDFQDIDLQLSAITSIPAGPSLVSYATDAPIYPIATPISANLLQYTGNVDKVWLMAGTLPAGLYLETSTGDLVGTTSAMPSEPASLTIGVSFLCGTAVETKLTVSVENVVPVFTMDVAGVYTIEVGVPVPSSVCAILSQGVGVNFTATDLPPGLTVHHLTGRITGEPTTPTCGTRTLVITATNDKGYLNVHVNYVVLDNRRYNVEVENYLAKDVRRFASLLGKLAFDEVHAEVFALGLTTHDIARKMEAGLAMRPARAVLVSVPSRQVASDLADSMKQDSRYGAVVLSTSFCAPSFQYLPLVGHIGCEFFACVVQDPNKGVATCYKFAQAVPDGVTLASDTGEVSVRSNVALDQEFKILGYNVGGTHVATLQVMVVER